jgi:hypothetical protein
MKKTTMDKLQCISNNFMYTMDQIQVCRKRKKKAMILKLDFRKPFDMVS